jgi:hypothetical protein
MIHLFNKMLVAFYEILMFNDLQERGIKEFLIFILPVKFHKHLVQLFTTTYCSSLLN